MCKKCKLQFELQSVLQIISGIQYRDEIYANAEINQRLSYLLLLQLTLPLSQCLMSSQHPPLHSEGRRGSKKDKREKVFVSQDEWKQLRMNGLRAAGRTSKLD